MLYRFRSAACGDLIMLGPQGDRLLRLLGRDAAPQGIIEPSAMAAAIAALQDAIAAEATEAGGTEAAAGEADAADRDAAISLRRRLWPMVEMLRRAQSADKPIVWGV